MEVLRSRNELQAHLNSLKHEGSSIALVPTMGALHRGHLELVRIAQQKADVVVVSIFVNPTQFLAGEDLDKYPRTLEADKAACEAIDVDVLFVPDVDQIYSNAPRYIGFTIDQLADQLCGASRPGHFQGVIQVVNKLFNIVRPDIAIFGQKDYQQFRLLECMNEEFNHGIKLIMAPIVRDGDMLALSSRNRYLSVEERQKALSLYSSLVWIKDGLFEKGDINKLLEQAQQLILKEGLKIDYLGVYDAKSLQPVSKVEPIHTYLIAGAIYAGSTRLIDNIVLRI